MATEDEKRLERYKTRLGIVSSIILAGVGLIVSFILAVNAHHQEAEAKRIVITRLRQLEFPLRTNTEHYDL